MILEIIFNDDVFAIKGSLLINIKDYVVNKNFVKLLLYIYTVLLPDGKWAIFEQDLFTNFTISVFEHTLTIGFKFITKLFTLKKVENLIA